MKNYLYSTMMMVAMMVAALSFIACGGSDDDEDDRGGTSSSELVGIWDLKTVENFFKGEATGTDNGEEVWEISSDMIKIISKTNPSSDLSGLSLPYTYDKGNKKLNIIGDYHSPYTVKTINSNTLVLQSSVFSNSYHIFNFKKK